MPYLGRAPTVANNVTGDLAVSGSILADGQISGGRINHKLALDGSDASSPQANENDQFIFEDGGTDGSGTNAGDNLLLEDVTPSFVGTQTILGENVTSLPFANINSGTSTSGQLLTSGGVGVAPSFTTVTGGSLVYITSVTISSGVAEFTSLTTYDTYFFRYEGMIGSASASDIVTLSDDNASSYESSGYAWSGVSYPSNGSLSNPYHRSDSRIHISYSYAGSAYRAGHLYLHRKGKSATGSIVVFQNWGLEDASGYETGRSGGGMLDTGTIVNAIKFGRSSGNYTSGKVYAYGISQS